MAGEISPHRAARRRGGRGRALRQSASLDDSHREREGSMTTRRAVIAGLAVFLPQFTGGVDRAAARDVGGREKGACRARRFTAMIGDYPHTHALVAGQLPSSCVALDFAKVSAPAAAFARTVAMEFDVSELSLVTFLMAKAYGRKLVLLPAVNLARFQHPYLVYDSSRGTMTPKDLEHAHIGTRLFTATTPT